MPMSKPQLHMGLDIGILLFFLWAASAIPSLIISCRPRFPFFPISSPNRPFFLSYLFLSSVNALTLKSVICT